MLSTAALFAQNSASQEQKLLATVRRDPNNASAAAAMGTFYFRKMQWRLSAHWLQKAYTLSKGNSTIGFDLALARMQAGELDQAQKQIEILQSQKESAKLHGLMAEIDNRKGDYRAAAQEYHRAAEMEPTEEHIFELATYLVQHKQYVGALNDAIKFYRYGVEKFPSSARLRVGLGVALYAASDYDEAVRVFCEAIDLNPKDTRPLQFLGRASLVSPELAPAVDARLKEFEERYPDNAAANYFYALALWERSGEAAGKDRTEIVRLLRRAEALKPGWYEPHFQLGVVYESQQKYADAIIEMKRAVAIDEDYFPAHYRLAILYNRMGQRAKAKTEADLVKRLQAKGEEMSDRHDVIE